MAKEKLFTPEDFDKPTEKKWYQSKGTIIVLVLIAIAIIVGLVIYSSSDKPNKGTQSTQSNEPIVESVASASPMVEAVDSVIETAPESVQTNVEQDDTSLSNPIEKVKPKETSVETKSTTATVTDSTESEALKVIHGDYGNVPQRKELLGTRFNEIQARVNQLKREGKF